MLCRSVAAALLFPRLPARPPPAGAPRSSRQRRASAPAQAQRTCACGWRGTINACVALMPITSNTVVSNFANYRLSLVVSFGALR